MKSACVVLMVLAGCGSETGSSSCPKPSVQPKCVSSCVFAWLALIDSCAPSGTCTSQVDGSNTRYCFANGTKLTVTSNGTGSQRSILSKNGSVCLAGTVDTGADGTITTDYDPGACGTLSYTK